MLSVTKRVNIQYNEKVHYKLIISLGEKVNLLPFIVAHQGAAIRLHEAAVLTDFLGQTQDQGRSRLHRVTFLHRHLHHMIAALPLKELIVKLQRKLILPKCHPQRRRAQ